MNPWLLSQIHLEELTCVELKLILMSPMTGAYAVTNILLNLLIELSEVGYIHCNKLS
jgi:hypothetical protein